MKSLLKLIPYLKRYKKTLAFGVLTVILSNLFYILMPHYIGKVMDEIVLSAKNKIVDKTIFINYAMLIVGFAVAGGYMTYLTRQTIIVVSRKIEFDLRNDFLEHIQKLPMSFFQHTSTGDLMARATNDIASVRNVLGPGIMYPVDTLLTLIFALGIMLTKDWSLTLYSLIPLPLVSIAVFRIGKSIHKKYTQRQEQFSQLTTAAQENFSGIRIIKAFAREKFEIGQFKNLSLKYMNKNLELAKIQSLMWPLMFLLVGISLLIVIYFGGLKVIRGEITIGTLSALISYLLMLIWPMIAIGWVTNILQQGAASMQRLINNFETIPEIRDTEKTDKSIKSISGKIEFKNVSFTHLNAVKPSLKNINLQISEGVTVAIIGPTGSGKSTLVNLIPRLFDSSEGEILINGKNIKEIPLEILRKNIGYVTQETFLFSETIKENINYGLDFLDIELIKEAAEISQISKDMADFPQDYETLIGERGITLSGGQKQRTSIARAILRKPKILILDDALSSVDTETEEAILVRLKILMRERTSLIISHRVSTVKDADIIIVLKDGEIFERGTHKELILQNGYYTDLYNKQLLEKELESL
ncbi:MAG: ABC transporter ATP-binding protein [Bacteroidota bacterium]